MSSLNRVELLGNLGQDPEVRTTTNGTKVAQLSLATSETWRDGQGQKQERKEWHCVVVWGGRDSDGLAGVIEQYCRKGGKLYVAGKLQTRKWQDQNGQDRWTTEIVVNGRDGKLILLGNSRSTGDPRDAPPPEPPPETTAGNGFDDDIPF